VFLFKVNLPLEEYRPLALECGDLSPLFFDGSQIAAEQSGDKSPHSKT